MALIRLLFYKRQCPPPQPPAPGLPPCSPLLFILAPSPVVPAPAPQPSISVNGQRVAAATNKGATTKAAPVCTPTSTAATAVTPAVRDTSQQLQQQSSLQHDGQLPYSISPCNHPFGTAIRIGREKKQEAVGLLLVPATLLPLQQGITLCPDSCCCCNEPWYSLLLLLLLLLPRNVRPVLLSKLNTLNPIPFLPPAQS